MEHGGRAECFTFEKAQAIFLAKFNGHFHGSFQALAEASERKEALFFFPFFSLFGSCFSFNDLLQAIVPIYIGVQVLLSLKYQAIH